MTHNKSGHCTLLKKLNNNDNNWIILLCSEFFVPYTGMTLVDSCTENRACISFKETNNYNTQSQWLHYIICFPFHSCSVLLHVEWGEHQLSLVEELTLSRSSLGNTLSFLTKIYLSCVSEALLITESPPNPISGNFTSSSLFSEKWLSHSCLSTEWLIWYHSCYWHFFMVQWNIHSYHSLAAR